MSDLAVTLETYLAVKAERDAARADADRLAEAIRSHCLIVSSEPVSWPVKEALAAHDAEVARRG